MNQFKYKLKTKLGMNLIIVTYSIVLFLALLSLKDILRVSATLMGAISPFTAGLGVAFVLNLPMKLIENKILIKYKLNPKVIRGISILTTFILLSLLLYGVIVFVFPQIRDSIVNLTNSIPDYARNLELMANEILREFEISEEIWMQLSLQLDKIIAITTNILANAIPFILNLTLDIANGTINFFLSIIISIYMLASKERIIRSIKKVVYALFHINIAKSIIKVGKLTNYTFSRFIGGQLTEAFILAGLTGIGMFILKIDYAILISVIIGITSIVPIIGPIIGAVPCVFILLMINPIQALIFLIFIIVLQQIEGNLIYPKVVGSSIGISGLWIMFSILLGGSLYGILGIILGIPTFAVLYTLLKEWSGKKISEKNIEIE